VNVASGEIFQRKPCDTENAPLLIESYPLSFSKALES
jgi:hypothetical protein